MKRSFMALVAIATFSISAVAQRGGHGGGPPIGGGMGPSHSMGNPNNTQGQPKSHDQQQQPSDLGKKSPDEILSNNTKLSSNLEKLLPKGVTAQQACSGFKNLGQCVSAIHVAHNLDIPFDQLKDKLTGANPESLGKAIQQLKPDADAKAEAKKGQKQADHDLRES
jgi:hypothetical protein